MTNELNATTKTTKTVARKSEFSGHCQFCGRLQKLPKGVLSLHGYSVTHGYFSGVCRGSSFKPFEKSCDQVKRYIAEAQSSLEALMEQQKALRNTKPGTTKAWMHVSFANPKGRYYSRTGHYMEVEINAVEVPFSSGDGSYFKFSYEGATAWKQEQRQQEGYKPYMADVVKPVTTEINGYFTSLDELVAQYNGYYADALERQCVQLRAYVAWQKDRVKNWKEADLLPHTAKDKEGFKVEEN